MDTTLGWRAVLPPVETAIHFVRYLVRVGGLLGESNTLKRRGTINLQEGSNLAKYIQDNSASLKIGIHTVNGVDGGRTPITDWGTLEKISSDLYVFYATNLKVMLSFNKDLTRWTYTKYSGPVTNGPF